MVLALLAVVLCAASTSAQLCVENTCCNLTSTNSCSFLSLIPGEDETSVFLLPSGATRCIFDDSGPFAFQVFPGATDKLMIYFQGGGACWDEFSTDADFCLSTVEAQGPYGVFDKSDSRNPYADYTIIHINYCSGDLFAGNVTRDYKTLSGSSVVQVGINNVLSVIQWLQGQQKTGDMAARFTNLVVMGCSAGSIGAQIWARTLLQALPWENAAVVPDSYVGVFPPGSQGPLIQNYGMCNTFLLDADLNKICNNGTLTLQTYVEHQMALNSNVPYAFIQSKTDIGQRIFYSALAVSIGKDPFQSATEFYDQINDIFAIYNHYPNFLTYLITSDQHCYTPLDAFYTAIPTSARPIKVPPGTTKLYQWTSSLPLTQPGQVLDTICVAGSSRNSYCSPQVFPKNFTNP